MSDHTEKPVGTAKELAERMYMATRRQRILESNDERGAKLTNPPWDYLPRDRHEQYIAWAELAWIVGLPEARIAEWRGEVGALNAELVEARAKIASLEAERVR